MDMGHNAKVFRPQSQTLALEPRILFDGAAASAAADQHHQDTGDAAQADAHPSTPDQRTAAGPTSTVPKTLVVLDSRVENREQLTAGLGADTLTLVVDAGQDALAAISAALAQMGTVDSIQVFSHGAAGQFTLGNQTFTAANFDQFGSTLGQWQAELSAGADIQLYGCDIGAGAAGQALVDRLARWTGADVGASSNATGSRAAGGDWALEVRNGVIDQGIALSATSLERFQGLLANAAPTTSVSMPSNDVLIGNTFTFEVDLRNGASQVGYAPYIDLFLPTTGKDGDDGISFVGASYLGQALTSYVVTFDAAGNATHPLAKGADGKPLVVTAASVGMRPGDQFVVLQVPYASVSQDQPDITVQVTARLSNLADTSNTNGSPALTINTRAGFEYGNDSLNNPTVDPSLVEASLHALVVNPTLVELTQNLDMTEGETATGPNFTHNQTVTVTPASGQTLHNVVVTQNVPDQVQITAITPGAGGTLTSVTLRNGTVLTNPALIAAAINSDSVFITAYSITYDSLSAPATSRVTFYVPEVGGAGNAVLDPNTGNPVTIAFGTPTATGEWTPLDPRDLNPPATEVDFSTTGDGTGAQFVAKSITLQKQAVLQTDLGSTGLSPGDTLRYVLNVALSDYFAFGSNILQNGQFRIVDTLADGQTISGPLTMTVSQDGASGTIQLVYTQTPNADGTTTLVIDMAESLRRASGTLGALFGDLAFDDTRTSATLAVISYNAVISQAYVSNYPPHKDINEGDSVGNNATLSATVLLDAVNLGTGIQTDSSSTVSTVPTSQVDIDILKVNNGAPPTSGEIRPGDLITFQLSYDLVTGDYENFQLTAYLPLPLLDVSGVTWTVGNGVGQWSFGPGESDPSRGVTVSSGPGNSVVFDFGQYSVNQAAGGRIELTFTLRVGDQPFADQRSLDVLAQSSQTTTINKDPLLSSDVAVVVSVAEPVLDIRHGVVSSSNGSITGTTGSWAQPGTGGRPFTGSVTELSAINGDVSGIDGGDRLRLATAIENSGGGGAYDVVTSITLPPDLTFIGGSLAAANLQIYRGDGTQLRAGVDYRVSGNQITFLDAGAQPTLLPGRAGTTADSSGQNIVVITYDVTVNNSVAASRTLRSTATLSHYASVEGGTDFTPVDLTEVANQQVAAPVISKTFAGGSLDNGDSSAGHTTGSNLVVGESMLYDIIVRLPEGTTRNLSIDDLIPPGMRLDTTFNNNLGYQQILTALGSGGSLSQDFAGSVVISAVGGVGGTLGSDGVDARFTFSVSATSADNNTGNNAFVIRVRLVASNVSGNQANRSLQNSATLRYQDIDGNTPNGTVALDRQVNLSGGAPTVTLREPTLQIIQNIDTTPDFGGFDQGDIIDFTLTLRNGTASSDFDAFDISLLDNLPSQLDGVTITGVVYQGATNNGGVDFVIQGGQLRTATGANIDIAKGGSIVLHLRGTVNATAAGLAAFTNNAQVRWTSLDGNHTAERTGADGVLNGGTLNDYRLDSALVFPVTNGVRISHVGGLPDTPPPRDASGNVDTAGISENVAVGEVIRYRVSVLVPVGDNPNYQIRIELGAGLSFIPADLNNILIAMVSNTFNGLSTDADLIKGGTLWMPGDQDSAVSQPINADLSGVRPNGVFDGNASNLSIVTNANGSQTVTFNLGNVRNSETSDTNAEGVILEFNVRVTNVASNQSGASLGVQAFEHVGLPGQDVDRGKSEQLFERVVEPSFTGLDKHVIDILPGTGSTTATVSVGFTQNGDIPAYNVHLQDQFPNGSNYQVQSILVNGSALDLANLPAGVRVTSSGALSVDFDRLAVGDRVQVVYRVTVPNAVVPDNAASAAVLTWSSLPTSFETGGWGGSRPGTGGTADGERTGQDGTSGLNNYILSEGAGLGVVQGTLWNDTNSATSSTTPDGPGLAGQRVQVTWAGADGVFGNADDRVFSTQTDSNGRYQFALLPAGNYLVAVPQSLQLSASNRFAVRIDTDTGTSVSGLGNVSVTLAEGGTGTANAGYVHLNEAPVNTLPGQRGQEDTVLHLNGLAVSDSDAGSGVMSVTLTVRHGVLWQSATPPAPGATPPAGASGTLTLTGTLSQLNALLSQLYYKGNQDFNTASTSETLTMVTNDRGNFGDANHDGIPGQNPQDALSDTDTVQLIVDPVNDTPVARPDSAIAVEAGGTRNQTPGSDPSGNVLANDSDVDIATNGDAIRVIRAGLQGGTQLGVPVNGTVEIVGLYGKLVISSAGGSTYIVDNDDPAVQALRLSGNTLQEVFTYTISDLAGATSASTLTVTIQGANDTPVAVNDDGQALEAGGVNNGTPGSNAVGNVLSNDTDVDQNGETKTVTGVRNLRESASGAIVPVTNAPVVINGTYGTLTISANGAYTYVVDNSNTAVQRLGANDQLIEYFTYRVTDAGNLSDLAELRITIKGAYDNPVASDDRAVAQAAATNTPGEESNPVGNVILFPSRGGGLNQPGGNGVDLDVDRADRPSTRLNVTGISSATELSSPGMTSVPAGSNAGNGRVIDAIYAEQNGVQVIDPAAFGTLTIGANGSFVFDVNSANATIQGLAAGQTVQVIYTYEITDTEGLTDRAQLVITIHGVNDPPVAQIVVGRAVEQGGVNNQLPGINPSGDVTRTSHDPDGDPITVSAIGTGTTTTTSVNGSTTLTGQYGTLTINPDGTYTYVLDNSNPTVQGLRTDADRLIDTFSYEVTDGKGGFSDPAFLFILIEGQNDNPVAADDGITAIEAGGVGNNQPGRDPTGNVLTNDRDVDSVLNEETKTVNAVRTGAENASGSTGSLGTELRGTYGWLTLNADGTYRYRLDNDNAAVQALRTSGNTLVDTFTYTVIDTAGATDQAALRITITGANDTPVARPDNATAVEAGGVANTTPGRNATGNVLGNDSDVDSRDLMGVIGVHQGLATGKVGSAFTAAYGTLTLRADGSFTYVVDDSNPLVQALRTSGETLQERFVYTVRDLAGATTTSILTITIQGRNDNPVASDDQATAIERGGTANGTSGLDPSGNVLANDTDVDAGDSKQVDGIRTGSEAAGGTFVTVSGNQVVNGVYGVLTIDANGRYSYRVNNNDARVQALKAGQTLVETFTYRMHDTAGASDIAQLTITLQGAYDAPVANDDLALALAAKPNINNGFDPSGNVLGNDTDVDAGDSKRVSGIRTGQESAGGTLTGVNAGTDNSNGTLIDGRYGQLIIGADGTFTYRVDNSNPAVLALGLLETLSDYFTYEVRDAGGLVDQAQIHIVVFARNSPPDANPDTAEAVEAGGLNNTTPGVDPSGNVLGNDRDAEGDAMTVVEVRTGTDPSGAPDGVPGQPLKGQYGTLVLDADGTWHYQLDNDNPAVQALRTASQTLTDVFTYVVQDRWTSTGSTQLVIVIRGANDTPVAQDDTAIAVEAGGVSNTRPGVDPTGNVLANDTDVDSLANGETRQVLTVTSETGQSATAGILLQGRYGTLRLNADGSYRYEVNNADPRVQALRSAGETLREVFTYQMRDAAGATSTAQLNVTVQGADDNPVARDDSNVASDQVQAPQSSGNVLPNDSDVDGGDRLTVVGVRTGAEQAGGTQGSVGQVLAGRYGFLTLNADGSYTYTIDQSNPEVLAAAGLGQVLQDVFTYTIADLAGATDQAQLTINLDIASPYIPPGPYLDRDAGRNAFAEPPLDFEPALYVEPEIRRIDIARQQIIRGANGDAASLFAAPEIRARIAPDLDLVPGQFVAQAVAESRQRSELDTLWVQGRNGVTGLSADGLLSDPSLWAPLPADMVPAADRPQTAPGLRAQLQDAAQRRGPRP